MQYDQPTKKRKPPLFTAHDICFVGLKCADLLLGNERQRYLGGIERDLVTIGKRLAEKNRAVAFVVYADRKRARPVRTGSIDIFPAYQPDSGIPLVRFFFPRAFKVIKATISANAKVVVQMGAGVETGISAIACMIRGKRTNFVFLTASDGDCEKKLPALSSILDRVFYRIGLMLCDEIVVQTERQRSLLKENFGKNSSVLRLPNELGLNSGGCVEQNVVGARPYVIWIGRFDNIKRPDWFVDLASRCPKVDFKLIGNANAPSDYAKDVMTSAKCYSNLTLTGKLGCKALVGEYQRASYLCCTSEFEGFPAIFLEAWSFGLPILSLFDPDELISRNAAGASFNSIEDIAEFLNSEQFLDRRAAWSKNARQLFDRSFSPDRLTERFCDIVLPS